MGSGKFSGRPLVTFAMIAIAMLVLAIPAFAQFGRIQGKVTDEKGQAVEGATIVVNTVPQSAQKWEAKSEKNGSYIIISIPRSGQYLVTAEKAGVGMDGRPVQIRIGQTTPQDFRLTGTGPVTTEQAAKNAAVKKAFEAGVIAAQAGNHQEAVNQFNQAVAGLPNCSDCYYNIGVSQAQLKQYDAAEVSYKKAIELRADYPEAYNALAEIYTAQRKMDLAAEAATKAAQLSSSSAGGGNATTLYNAGVGLWNAGKLPEAKVQFEAAIKVDPKLAAAHYQMGLVLVNEGKMAESAAEFETYLQLDPNGQYAAQAKALVAQLKK